MITVLFLVLAACTTTPSDTAVDTAETTAWPGSELVWEDAPTLPAGQLPPPGDFDLGINVLSSGQSVTFTVTNGPPSATMFVAYSFQGVGNGPCPAFLNGACAGIRPLARLVPGLLTTNAAGEAALTLTVPYIFPTDIAFQAVSPSTAELSNVVTGFIFPPWTSTDPTLDRDGDTFSHEDGDCNDNDDTIYPGAPDVSGDYVDSDCDGSDDAAACDTAIDAECDGFYLADNGITVVCPNAAVGDTGVVDGVTYTKRDRASLWIGPTISYFETACTSGITDMSNLFYVNSYFVGDINHWDVSSVTNMRSMFEDTSFNNELSAWDVSNVTNMVGMFHGTSVFNRDISSWDVSAVTHMDHMFFFATAFDQDLSGWCLPNIVSEPFNFSQSATNWTLPQPLWGDLDCDGVVDPDPDPEGDGFYLADNGITVVCPDAAVGDTGVVDGVSYTKRDRDFLLNNAVGGEFETACTSGITNLSMLFMSDASFNEDISSWDVSSVTDMHYMFSYTGAFNQDIGAWDVSNVMDMSAVFLGNPVFNQDIGDWDVSNVTHMPHLFDGAAAFQQDIGGWDVSNVTDMYGMFSFADSFNHDLGSWDVSNVTYMTVMFRGASSFNQDLSSWCLPNIASEPFYFSQDATNWTLPQPLWGDLDCDGVVDPDPEGDGFYLADNGITIVCPDAAVGDTGVVDGMTYTKRDRLGLLASTTSAAFEEACTSDITDMSNVFASNISFGGDISHWDVSSVVNMAYMFSTSTFDNDIGNWDVSNVTTMDYMFYQAAFNQDISGWDTSAATSMLHMFASTPNFNQDLSGWCVPNIPSTPWQFDLWASSWTLPRPVWGTCP